MKNAGILLLCLMLAAGQAFYVAVSANPNLTSSNNLLALAQPIAIGIPRCPIAVEQQDVLREQESQYIKGLTTYAHVFSDYETNWLANSGVIIGPESRNDFIDLENGNVLLSPEQDIVVSTHKGKVYIGSGTTVFLTECGNNVVVYDLVQSKPKQISVVVGRDRLIMKPGQMLVLTEQNINDFEKLEANCHAVAYHNARPLDLDNGTVNAFVANFSIPSAMVTIQPLKRLIISKNEEDKSLLDKLMKSAVLAGDLRVPQQTRNKSSVALSAEQN